MSIEQSDSNFPALRALSSVPQFTDRDGNPYGEPQVRLRFESMQRAADFINEGLRNSRWRGLAITTEYLKQAREAPTGETNQYDAFVSRQYDQRGRETGEVNMFLRHYGRGDHDSRAQLGDFVVTTLQGMAAAEAAEHEQ